MSAVRHVLRADLLAADGLSTHAVDQALQPSPGFAAIPSQPPTPTIREPTR